MARSIEIPRIVCMKCPSVATLHFSEYEAYQDAVLVWVECHGEHIAAIIDGETLLAKRHGTNGIPLEALTPIPVAHIEKRWVDIETRVMELGNMAGALQRFLAVAKHIPEGIP